MVRVIITRDGRRFPFRIVSHASLPPPTLTHSSLSAASSSSSSNATTTACTACGDSCVATLGNVQLARQRSRPLWGWAIGYRYIDIYVCTRHEHSCTHNLYAEYTHIYVYTHPITIRYHARHRYRPQYYSSSRSRHFRRLHLERSN